MRGTSGSSWRGLALASLLLACSAPAWGNDHRQAAPRSATITVPSGSLADAVAAIARALHVEIVSLEPTLATVTVPQRVLPGEPVRALARVLAGTGLRAVRIGPASFRIERAPPPRAVRKPPPALPTAPPDRPEPVTVIASKFPTRLRDYPGMLVRMPGDEGAGMAPARQLGDLSRRSPAVFATAFGDGREKLFVRGIADSSFNGASQPTTAIYLDDAPIGLGSPNPNLRLYDVASVEVLEGPQGTLYGGGSIGGVVRITSNPVDLDRWSQSGLVEASLPEQGRPGWKLAGAANLPLLEDKIGARIVGYTEREGGYIDAPAIGANLNQVDVSGGRGTLTIAPDPSLRIDLGALYQQTQSNDSQYVDRPGALLRSGSLRQPFGSDLVLGRAAVRKSWDSGLAFSGQASFGRRYSADRFDAAYDVLATGATAYDLERLATAWTGEARLARTGDSGVSWVLGLSAEHVSDDQSRAFDSPKGTLTLDEVSNITRSVSAFAQARRRIAPRLQATVGLRYTIARTDSEPARGRQVSFIRGDTARHFDPTLALLWRASERVSTFARFQTGYRNGGVTVARGVGRVADFAPDAIVMGETGVKLKSAGDYGWEWAGSVSYARWRRVLAELVTRRGTPITSNIGDARLLALESSIAWRHRSGLRLAGALLYTANHLTGDLAMQTPAANRRLPDTPALTAQADASYEWAGPHGSVHALSARMHYVGRSVLGPGALLDLSQGNYAVVDAGASTRHGAALIRLGVDNLFDTRASRFALGNPLQLYQRQGYAPVEPRTVSLSFSIGM